MEPSGTLSDLLIDKQGIGLVFDEDSGSPAKLPEVPRTFTYGDDAVETYWDEQKILNKNVKEDTECDTKSPKQTDGEFIPQSPIISSSSRRGSRKHNRLKDKRNSAVLPKPLFLSSLLDNEAESSKDSHDVTLKDNMNLKVDVTPNGVNIGDDTFSDLDFDMEEIFEESPCSRVAASLGCDKTSVAWQESMATPSLAKEVSKELSTLERKELLPSDTSGETDKSSSRKLTPKNLFYSSQENHLEQVLHLRRDQLVEVDEDSDDEKKDMEAKHSKIEVKQKSSLKKPDIDSGNTSEKYKIGFKTGSRMPVSVSALLIEETKRKFEVHSEPDPKSMESPKRPISSSDNSLASVAKKLKNDKVLEVGDMKSEFVGFQTAGGREIQISERALLDSRKKYNFNELAEEGSKENSGFASNFPSFTGFQTAGGSSINISKEALDMAKKRLESIEGRPDISVVNNKEGAKMNMTVGFKTASGSDVSISKEAMEKAKNKLASTSAPGFVGFQTAKGSKIHISEKAIEEAKKKFENSFNHQKNEIKSIGTPLVGFQTAKGTKIHITDEAILEAKKKLQENNSSISETGTFSADIGFQTAKGSKITISDEALAKAKQQMNELKGFNSNSPAITSYFKPNPMKIKTGFQTASGSNVEVSDTAFREAKDKIKDYHEEDKQLVNDENSDFEFDSEDDKVLLELCDNMNYDVKETKKITYTCEPFELQFKGETYTCAPDIFEEKNEENISSFKTPKSASEKRSLDKNINVDIVLGKRRIEEDKTEFLSIVDGRAAQRRKQKEIIEDKKGRNVQPKVGSLFKKKTSGNDRKSLKDLVSSPSLVQTPSINIKWIKAESFVFEGLQFFSENFTVSNIKGVPLGDGILVILDDDGNLGYPEMETAFLAAPGVDPKIIPNGWFLHHYRWILWTLRCYESFLQVRLFFASI